MATKGVSSVLNKPIESSNDAEQGFRAAAVLGGAPNR